MDKLQTIEGLKTMNYENAADILPEDLLKRVQKFAAGKLIYVPETISKRSWGETSGYKQYLEERNHDIKDKFTKGVTIDTLADAYSLSVESIKKIIYNKNEIKELAYIMTRFSVTVPTTLNFVMSKSGEVFSADNAQIINNSSAAVSVKQVNLEALNGWSLTEYSETAIASAKVDSKIIGLKINSAETSSSGLTCSFAFDDWVIEKDAYAQIPYDAVVSATSTPIENEQVMNAVFIVDWKTNY